MPFLESVTRGRGRAAGAPRGGRPPLRALRRRQPDQRPEPGADRGAARRARCPRGRPADLLREPQLASVARRHVARDARRRRQQVRSRSSPRPSPPTRGAGSTGRTSSSRRRPSGRSRRKCSSSVRSATTPDSSSRTSSSCVLRSPGSRPIGAGARTSRSRRTASRSRWHATVAYEAQLEEAARLVAEGAGVAEYSRRVPEPKRPAAGALARAGRLRPPARRSRRRG